MDITAPYDASRAEREPAGTARPGGERVVVTTVDGHALVGHRFEARSTHASRGIVVLPAAMGVKQSFYFPFAQYLAERGFAVLTFDYRGMGLSAPKRLRHFPATLDDWAHRDYDAVLRQARAWLDEPSSATRGSLFVVGHSLGGQLAGIVPSRHLIDGLVTIASGSGYWRENVARLRRSVWFLWYFAVPLYTALAGYFPGRRVRKVGDLPAGVVRQWSRWCRDPDYLVGVEATARDAFATLTCPLLALSFTDDELMSARNTESLHDFYVNAAQTRRRVAPVDVGAKRIGHFGFFRPAFEPTLWRDVADWLQRRPIHPETRWTS